MWFKNKKVTLTSGPGSFHYVWRQLSVTMLWVGVVSLLGDHYALSGLDVTQAVLT
jgi:hypothetical protein